MKPFLLAVIACCSGAAAVARADEKPPVVDPAVFTSRMRIDQKAVRLIKVVGDRRALPLTTDTLSLLASSPSVGGRAAQDAFRIDAATAERVVHITATPTAGEGAFLVKLELAIKAGQLLERPVIDAYTHALRNRLQEALNQSIAADRQQAITQQGGLLERRVALEQQLHGLRRERMEQAEKAGLAEAPAGAHRQRAADLSRQAQEQQIELAVKQARREALEKARAQGGRAAEAESDPRNDPVLQELEKLARAQNQVVEALRAKKDTPREELARAEAAYYEVSARCAGRREEVLKRDPAYQLKLLAVEVAEIEARLRTLKDLADQARTRSRELSREEEQIAALQDREALLRKRIEAVDKGLEDVSSRLDGLQAVTVTGVAEESGR